MEGRFNMLRAAIVTGASRGIGLEITRRLLGEGCQSADLLHLLMQEYKNSYQ